MGRERKNNYERKKGTTDQRERILIVCEDSKSSPYYFESLAKNFRVGKKNCKVESTGDRSSPKNVVDDAIRLAKEEIRKGGVYDYVYCCFDKDSHDKRGGTYTNACKRIKDDKTYNLVSITSIPCFEYWVLMHFHYTLSPFSNCDEIIRKIRGYFPNYKKADSDIYKNIKDKGGSIENAIGNSKRGVVEVEENGTDNPSTNIHTLVEKIISMSPD